MSLDRALITERLELRPLSLDDTGALWKFVSDPELPRMMSWDAHKDPSETRKIIEMMIAAREAGTGYVWTLRHKNGGEPFGMVGLHDLVRTVRAWRMDRAELGYWCGPTEERNRGLMTEAAREVVRFGFEDLGLHKIIVGCVKENEASRRVIEKLGFRFLGEQRDHFFRFDRWWNHLSYEMLAGERA